MALTKRQLADATRKAYVTAIREYLEDALHEEVLQVGSNELAFPTVDAGNNDIFITITVKVPQGSRDGDPYDGYAMAEDYAMRVAERQRKAEASAKKKKKE